MSVVDVLMSDRKIVSRSEHGSYRYDGTADMKVLRKKALDAVRYFQTSDREMESGIGGFAFSVMDNGKLSNKDSAYLGNVIIRSLKRQYNGYYEGRMTLSYDDRYNDGRGIGGYGSIIIGNVTDVRIDGDYLVISGEDGGRESTYRYLIQDQPDTKPVVRPIPKGGKVPEIQEGRTDPSFEDLDSLCILLHDVAVAIRRQGQWYNASLEPLPLYTEEELARLISDADSRNQICDMFLDCYISHFSEHWSHWSEFGTTYRQWKQVCGKLRSMKIRERPSVKPDRPAAENVGKKPSAGRAPSKKGPKQSKPKAKSEGKTSPKSSHGGIMYEVRVDGRVEGAFSSKTRAESLKRKLKEEGCKARIHVVFA